MNSAWQCYYAKLWHCQTIKNGGYMFYRLGMRVTAMIGNIVALGIIVNDYEQDCLSVASVDADILIPISCCMSIIETPVGDICQMSQTQIDNATRIYSKLLMDL